MRAMQEVRSGEVIAAEINGIKRQVEKTVRGVMLSGAMEIGALLIEAKAVVAHGEWGKWLETNVDYSQTTANDLMRLYTEYKDGQISLEGGPSNAELFGALAPSKALALLALPMEERKEYVQAKDVEDMSVRQLKEDLARVTAEKEAAEAAAEAASADAEGYMEKALAAEAKKAEAEQKLSSLEAKKADEIRIAADAAAKTERDKLAKELERTRENLKKALDREKEKEAQIDLLKQEAEEDAEEGESEEVTALRDEIARLEKALRAADPVYSKFGVLLEQFQTMFWDVLGMAQSADDPSSAAKMREILARVVDGYKKELENE